ncbi:MAG: ATP-binding cassette domain-containing protein, partial [Alphaproteobacteria bacterium]|nr:ATP-binding cassette domain-containing protein [Alphaproteobacteria bacterium]
SVEEGVVGYDGNPVLRNLSLRIDMDDRIALLGANGNGKSTLAKLLSGRLEPLAGQVRKPGKLRVGYFAQHQMEELHPEETPFQHMARVLPLAQEAKVRAHLGRFGFSQAHADVRVENLSGGEKSRLLFALMSRDSPHVMILDEPTNHLDIDSREALMAALNAYAGAVVLITHDPHLIEMVADRLWLVGDGACAAYDGDLADYRRMLLERARDTRRGARAEEGSDKASRKDARRAGADTRARQAPLRRKVRDAEKQLETLAAKRANILARIADPALYRQPAEALTALQIELAEVDRAAAAAETEWMEANLALEEASED